MDPYKAVPSRLPFSRAKLPKKVVLSYIADYLIIIVLAVIFEILDAIEPFQQHFALQNYTLQYPMALHERVPIFAAIVIAIGGPLVVISLYTLVIDGLFSHHKDGDARRGPYTLKKRLWELNCGILGLLLASGTAFVITNVMKNATGKPRPDFISRCLPRSGSVDPTPFGLSNSTICTQTDNSIMKDGFRSFPSGHSSSSFGGLFYLSLYLAGKLHLGDTRGFTWKVFVVLVPTLGAALIAISRIEDARHHPFDVLFGSALGILCAYVSYRQYFPPLSEPQRKGRAYPIRSWGSPSEAWPGEAWPSTTTPAAPADAAYEAYSAPKPSTRDAAYEAYSAPKPSTADEVELQPYARGPSPPGSQDRERANVFRAQVAQTERLREEQEQTLGGARTAYARGGREWDEESSGDEGEGGPMRPAPGGYAAAASAEGGRVVA